MSEPKTGKVYRAKIVPPQESHITIRSEGQRVENALSPGSRVELYGREWIVGKTNKTNDILTGRMGFERSEGTAEVWDEDRLDFREVAIPQGLTAPFAVQLHTLQVSIQPRGSIKANGMMRAIRELLSLEGEKWEIEASSRRVDFQDWRNSVDKITRVKFSVKQPNPHWEDSPHLEAVMEQAHAEYAKLEVASEDGIDTDAEFLKQSQNHVGRGYGTAEFRGIRNTEGGHTVESNYSSEVGSEEEAFEALVGNEGEVSPEEMAKIAALGTQNEGNLEA